jgi:hypothetical protein
MIEFVYICIVFLPILGIAVVSAWLLGGVVTDLILRIGGDE